MVKKILSHIEMIALRVAILDRIVLIEVEGHHILE